jgi:hypothetical protein
MPDTGLKVLSKETWYGTGYCGICGSEKIVPTAVRYWEPDEGWLMGVLCEFCTKDASERPPIDSDYAVLVANKEDLPSCEKIDLLTDLVDLDGAYSMSRD